MIKDMFFDSVDDDRLYGPDNFIKLFSAFADKGVAKNSFQLTIRDNAVLLLPGVAFFDGYYVILYEEYEIEIAENGEYKLVLRLDFENREFVLLLENIDFVCVNNSIYRDLAIAKINKAENIVITDLRETAECGYVSSIFEPADVLSYTEDLQAWITEVQQLNLTSLTDGTLETALEAADNKSDANALALSLLEKQNRFSIINDLETGGIYDALSAEQGKLLRNDVVNGKKELARIINSKGGVILETAAFLEFETAINALVKGYVQGDFIDFRDCFEPLPGDVDFVVLTSGSSEFETLWNNKYPMVYSKSGTYDLETNGFNVLFLSPVEDKIYSHVVAKNLFAGFEGNLHRQGLPAYMYKYTITKIGLENKQIDFYGEIDLWTGEFSNGTKAAFDDNLYFRLEDNDGDKYFAKDYSIYVLRSGASDKELLYYFGATEGLIVDEKAKRIFVFSHSNATYPKIWEIDLKTGGQIAILNLYSLFNSFTSYKYLGFHEGICLFRFTAGSPETYYYVVVNCYNPENSFIFKPNAYYSHFFVFNDEIYMRLSNWLKFSKYEKYIWNDNNLSAQGYEMFYRTTLQEVSFSGVNLTSYTNIRELKTENETIFFVLTISDNQYSVVKLNLLTNTGIENVNLKGSASLITVDNVEHIFDGNDFYSMDDLQLVKASPKPPYELKSFASGSIYRDPLYCTLYGDYLIGRPNGMYKINGDAVVQEYLIDKEIYGWAVDNEGNIFIYDDSGFLTVFNTAGEIINYQELETCTDAEIMATDDYLYCLFDKTKLYRIKKNTFTSESWTFNGFELEKIRVFEENDGSFYMYLSNSTIIEFAYGNVRQITVGEEGTEDLFIKMNDKTVALVGYKRYLNYWPYGRTEVAGKLPYEWTTPVLEITNVVPQEPIVLIDPTEIATLSVLSVEKVEAISVENGTDINAVITQLPAGLTFVLSDYSARYITITWSCTGYNSTTAGNYTFIGSYEISDIATLPEVSCQVAVLQ